MVVKGHHFPNVTLVGVVAADSSLNMEDYRANEKTFQILTQVAGRAGRENLPGNVIIQTYNPDSFSIECSKKQDYDVFYNTEIKLRKQLNYPPFCDIILFGISQSDEQIVENVSNKIYNILLDKVENLSNINLYKPRPAPIDKIKNRFRYRVILKGKFNNEIIEIINDTLQEIYKYNTKARVIVDVNPTNMM